MKRVHGASLANTFIWGAAIIAAAIVLRDVPQGGQVVIILGGAAGASMIIVSNALDKAKAASASHTEADASVEAKAEQNG
jgi:hypothetical protein